MQHLLTNKNLQLSNEALSEEKMIWKMLWFCSLFELPNSESAHQPLISNTKNVKFLLFAFLLLKFRSILFINFHVIFRKPQSLTHLLSFELVCGSAASDWKKAVWKFLFQRYFLNCLGSIQEVTTSISVVWTYLRIVKKKINQKLFSC